MFSVQSILESCGSKKKLTWHKLFINATKSSIKTRECSTVDDKMEFIKLVLNYLSKIDVANDIKEPKILEKSSKISRSFREKLKLKIGQEEEYLDDCFMDCTMSIIFAQRESEELGLAHAERSRILLIAKFYNNAFVEIDRALESSKCSQNLHRQLYKRKTILFKRMRRGSTPDINDENNHPMNVIKLENENFNFTGASDAVELKYNEKYGRHIVSTRRIKPGETLMMQKPYASVLHDDLRYKYCWNCKKRSWNSLPCENCTTIIFCSIECRNEAVNNYHDYECPVLCRMIGYKMETDLQIALQLAIKGFKESNSSFTDLKNNVNAIDDEPEGLMRGFPNGTFDPNKFSSIYSLSTNVKYDSSLSSEVLGNCILIAYQLVTKTNFIGQKLTGDLRVLKESKKFKFLIIFLIKLTYLVRTNGYVHDKYKNVLERIPIFHAIIPGISYCNHKCFKETISIFLDGYIIVKTLGPVKKGGQIFINYGPNHMYHTLDERKKILENEYNFICHCKACVDDWPMKCTELSSVNEKDYELFSDNQNIFRRLELFLSCIQKLMFFSTWDILEITDDSDYWKDFVKCFSFFYARCPKNSAPVDTMKLYFERTIELREEFYMTLMDGAKLIKEWN